VAWRRVGSDQPRGDEFLVPGAKRQGRGCDKATATLARSRNAVAIRSMVRFLLGQYGVSPCSAPRSKDTTVAEAARVLGLRPPYGTTPNGRPPRSRYIGLPMTGGSDRPGSGQESAIHHLPICRGNRRGVPHTYSAFPERIWTVFRAVWTELRVNLMDQVMGDRSGELSPIKAMSQCVRRRSARHA
jgi:hypothetical protein